jgi:hypothetical protein
MPFKKAKRLVKKARKTVKKLIPKEVRPFVPYIAAAMGPASLASTGIFSNPAVTKALIAGGTRFAIDDEADLKDVGITAALAASPDLIKQGSSSLAGKLDPKLAADIAGNIDEASSLKEATGITAKLASGLSKVGQTMPTLGEAGSTLGTQAKLVGGLGAVDATRKLAEIQQDEIDEYNRRLAEQGIKDKTQRRRAIRDIYLGVGYGEDYVDSMLDRYGYKSGGSTYTMEDILDMASEATKKKRKERDEEEEDELSEYIDIGARGLMSLAPKQEPMPIRPLQMAGGGNVDISEQFEEFLMERQRGIKENQRRRLMDEFEQYMKRQDPTVEAAEGGMMNLGGNEMDLRGGGFVPIGKKEKADDVPARLSKNEFVMTADAVRGAGNGDINEGARRMYQTMDKLEAMA